MASPGVTGRLGLACTLSTADLATRVAEWKAIDGLALIGRDEAGGSVTSTYRAAPETRAELARLVAAERGCCGTADWSLREEGDKLRVTVRAARGPPRGLPRPRAGRPVRGRGHGRPCGTPRGSQALA